MKATKGKLTGRDLRQVQIEAINFIASSSKKFIAINAPTGAGKSQIAMEAVKPPFFYLCSSRHLQVQLQKDFTYCSTLWGRKHYYCHMFENAENCSLVKKCSNCQYEEEKEKALSNKCSILNFSYFITSSNYTNFIKKDRHKPRTIIIDEADAVENVLVEFISFVFNIDTLKRINITILPEKKTVIDSFSEFILQAYPIVKDRYKEYKTRVNNIIINKQLTYEQKRIIRMFNGYKKLFFKVRFLLECINNKQLTDKNWVYYFSGNTIYLKPKWITRELADRFLFNHGSKFIFMSATLPAKEVMCGLLGIHPDEIDYAEFPSSFNEDNRPVFFLPRWSMSHKSKPDEQLIKQEVLQLLEKEKERGIIHTVNYQLSSTLQGLSPRLFIHNPDNKHTIFQQFMKSKDGVFVSPSSIRGIDLPDDKARWILFLKAPFADLHDPLTSARCYSGKWGRLWYLSQCVQDIVQGSGRAVRHEKDWARVYVYDEKAKEILLKHPSLFPLWFREAVEFVYRETMKDRP